jgi:ribosome-binding protein aMBF1 (putative translation factor)
MVFMASCRICGKPEEIVPLFDGVFDRSVGKVCYNCSNREGITLIRKPTQEQLEQAQKRLSVREMMEKMSSPQQRIMVKDQMIAHKSLAKLKFPGMKQEHGDLVHNYDWVLKQARRHEKMTTDQLALKANVQRKEIESLEAGQLFPGFEAVANALERALDVKILKAGVPVAKLARSVQEKKIIENKAEQNILDSVRQKMKKHMFLVKKAKDEGVDYYEDVETKHDTIDVDEIVRQKDEEKKRRYDQLAKEIESDKFDFSNRDNLDNITLSDLADLKKLKQEKERLDKE